MRFREKAKSSLVQGVTHALGDSKMLWLETVNSEEAFQSAVQKTADRFRSSQASITVLLGAEFSVDDSYALSLRKAFESAGLQNVAILLHSAKVLNPVPLRAHERDIQTSSDERLFEYLTEITSKPEDELLIIFAKNEMSTLAIVDQVYKSNMTADFQGEQTDALSWQDQNYLLQLISGVGAKVRKYLSNDRTVVIPESVQGLGISHIGRAAFSGKKLTSLMTTAPLTSIGQGAFFKCKNLSVFLCANSVEHIGRSAFAQCISLKTVELPDGLLVIGTRAFKGCSQLATVSLPASLQFIGEEAFAGCSTELVFTVHAGSYAHHWATKLGYKVSINPGLPVEKTGSDTKEKYTVVDGLKFKLLPGNSYELHSVCPDAIFNDDTVILPQRLGEYPVRGIGRHAIHNNPNIKQISIPETVSWISPEAIVGPVTFLGERPLAKVSAISSQSLATTPPVRIRQRNTQQAGHATIKVSIRIVCFILKIDVPADLEPIADEPFPSFSAGLLTSDKGSLFFGDLKPAKQQLINKLLLRGVKVFVSSHQVQDEQGMSVPTIIHNNPSDAFQMICAWLASLHNAKKIALTGSVGKTTTKEMVQLVSSEHFRTLYSKGNQNGVAQVGRYIQRLTQNTEVYIQETGAARPGLVESDAKMLKPDAFIITNIGLNHIGNYGGSQQALLADKISHDQHMPDSGVAFVNYDDPILKDVQLQHQIIYYSAHDSRADYFASDVHVQDGVIDFLINERRSSQQSRVRLVAFGNHNVSNAVVAFAVGRWLGVPSNKAVAGLEKYRGEGLRQNLLSVAGRRILVDCYNASEDAAIATAEALETIKPNGGGRRILVFADIDDKLGSLTETVHRRLGTALAAQSGLDLLVCFGDHARWTAEEAEKLGLAVFASSDRSELERFLGSQTYRDDVLAFKGGQQMALSITIDHLFGTALSLLDGDVLVKRGKDIMLPEAIYRSIKEYGVELRKVSQSFTESRFRVVSSVDGKPVRRVGRTAFIDSTIESIEIPEPVETIATSAFFRAFNLREVKLPTSLKLIDRSAFNNCRSIEEIDLPYGTTTIGKRAFYKCTALRRISIPETVLTIDEEVFLHCKDLTVECKRDSFADVFCRKNWPNITISYIS